MFDERKKAKKKLLSLENMFWVFGASEEWKKREKGSTLLLLLFILFTIISCGVAYLAVYYVSSKNEVNELLKN